MKKPLPKIRKGKRSEAAAAVAREVLETILQGKIPNKMKIAIKHGYAPTTAGAGLVTNRLGYREVVEPFVEKLTIERDRALSKMKGKISEAKYRDLVDSVDKLTKNIELLSGRPTDRSGIDIPPGKYAILIQREAKEIEQHTG